MKSLDELKKMINECIENRKPNYDRYDNEDYDDWTDEEKEEARELDNELYEEYKKYNFLAYNIAYNKANLYNSYEDAKNFAEQGGQVLVIDKEKIYIYKEKSDEEYFKYLENEIKNERYNNMNKWGL